MLVLAGCGQIARPEGWSAGVVVDDMLVMGTMEGTVIALDKATGATKWRFELKGIENNRAVYGAPAYADGTLYIGGYDGILYALSTGGNLKWQEVVGDGQPIVGGPVVVNGMVLVGSSDGNMYAFETSVETATGSLAWTAPTGDKVWSTPLVADDVAYFGSLDHSLHAVSLQNGDPLWEFEAEGGITGALSAAGSRIYVGAFDSVLYAVDAGTGQEIGRFDGAKGWYWAAPVVHEGAIYAPSLDGRLYALDLDTLSPIWPSVDTGEPIAASPVVVGNRIVIPSNDGTLRLARISDGGDVRRCDMESRIKSLTVDGRNVYVAMRDRSIRSVVIDSNGDPDEEWSRFTDNDEPEPSDRSRPC